MSTSTSFSVEETLKKASSARNAGRLDEAERLYRSVLQYNPQDAEAQKGLHRLLKGQKKPVKGSRRKNRKPARKVRLAKASSVSGQKPKRPKAGVEPAREDLLALAPLLASGQLCVAEVQARQLTKKYPKASVPLSVLGSILLDLGKFEEAVANYQQALRIDPDNSLDHCNLGRALSSLGRLEEALAAFLESLRIKPDHADAHNNLGNTYKSLGRLEESVASYREALKLRPDFVAAHNNLGNALCGHGDIDEAAACFRKALEIKPDYALGHNNLGNALRELGSFEEAEMHFQEALKMEPDNAAILKNLGDLYERTNQVEQAEECIQKALCAAPGDPAIIRSWALLLRRKGETEKAIQTLEPLVNERIPQKLLSEIHNELGKLHDRKKNMEKAFHHFATANDLDAASTTATPFNKDGFLSEVQQAANLLNSGYCQSLERFAKNQRSDSPAFLIGFPRSGTTLLDQILDNHPGIQVMEEKPILREIEQSRYH